MPKLLVTGASGYLGAALVARAVAAGWDVVGTWCTRAPADFEPGARSVRLDVRDAPAVRRLIAVERCDAIVHTAYRQHGEEAVAINADGAGHVAAAARGAGAGARLVHVSTDAVFAGDLGRPLREDDPVAPVTAYGATKARGEELVAAADPGAVIVRTSLLYGGPGREPSKHERLALAAARGEQEVAFFDDELRSPVQVDDLADALLELATLDVAGPLHVAGADVVSRADFARLIAASAGEDPARIVARPRPVDRPGDCSLDVSNAQALLRTPLPGARDVLGNLRP